MPVAHGMTPFVSDLSWENFELGFWHPFGSHGRESPEDIINRKRSETEKMDGRCGHFNIAGQNRSMSGRELSFAKPRGPVVVFCSRGNSAVDPDRPGALTRTADCREYRFIGDNDAHWQPVPPLIRVPPHSGQERPQRPLLWCDVSITRSNYSSPLLWSGFPAVSGMKVRFRRGLSTSSAEAAKSQCGMYARFLNCATRVSSTLAAS